MDIAKAIRQKQAELRIDWARRHPDKARAERDLRKERREARERFGHKVHGTIETHFKASRTRQGALARLYESGAITLDQLAAGVGIAQVHARIARDVAIGTVSLETRVDSSPRFDTAFFERLGAVRAEVAYTRWRRAAELPELVLAIVVEDVGVSVAARRYRMRNVRARRLLTEALDLWIELIGEAVHEIDDTDLLIAHLRLRAA